MGMSIAVIADLFKTDIVDKPVFGSCCISTVKMNPLDLHKVIAGVFNLDYLLAQIKPKRTKPLA